MAVVDSDATTPEYPANHAVQSAAIVTVLEHFYGPDIPP